MKKICYIIILIIVLISGRNLALASNTFENNKFEIEVFKGWEVLEEEQKYVFEGITSFYEGYDFIEKQNKKFEDNEENKFDKKQLKKEFEKKLTPVLISVLQKKEFDSTNQKLVIENIYTEVNSFKTNDLAGWEYQYNKLPKSRGAYYFLNLSVNNLYHIIFLLPKEFIQTEVYITFYDLFDFKKTLTVETDSYKSLINRQEFLQEEIERLEDKIK